MYDPVKARLHAITEREREMKHPHPAAATLEACDIVIRMTEDHRGRTAAAWSDNQTKEEK